MSDQTPDQLDEQPEPEPVQAGPQPTDVDSLPAEEQAEVQRQAAEQQARADDGLDDLTKDELLQEAERRGVEVKTSASKDVIRQQLRGQG